MAGMRDIVFWTVAAVAFVVAVPTQPAHALDLREGDVICVADEDKTEACLPEGHYRVASVPPSVEKLCEIALNQVVQSPSENRYVVYIREQGSSRARYRWRFIGEFYCASSAKAPVTVVVPPPPAPRPSTGTTPPQGIQDQLDLLTLRLYGGKIDGQSGEQTRRAVRSLQRSLSKSETGLLTTEERSTLRRLGAVVRSSTELNRDTAELALAIKECEEARRSCNEVLVAAIRVVRFSAPYVESDPSPAAEPGTASTGSFRPRTSAGSINCQVKRGDPELGDKGSIVVIYGRPLLFQRVEGMREGQELQLAIPSKEWAERAYETASRMQKNPTARPLNIMKAVGQKEGVAVKTFVIQTELIDPELYRDVMVNRISPPLKPDEADPRRVSYENAQTFIMHINTECQLQKIKFRLPSEVEMTYLMFKVHYEDRMDSGLRDSALKSCEQLFSERRSVLRNGSGLDFLVGFRDVAASHWQLTESQCQKFGPSAPSPACEGGNFVVKGGTALSPADECWPQFRAEASPNVRQPETSFRLVLEEAP